MLSSKGSPGTCIPGGQMTFLQYASRRTSSKGSERTCIRSGLATFLHCAFTAHADFVVDRWTADGERGLHRHFLFRQDVWTMFRG